MAKRVLSGRFLRAKRSATPKRTFQTTPKTSAAKQLVWIASTPGRLSRVTRPAPVSFAQFVDLSIKFGDRVKWLRKQVFPNDMLRSGGTIQVNHASHDQILIERKVDGRQAFCIFGRIENGINPGLFHHSGKGPANPCGLRIAIGLRLARQGLRGRLLLYRLPVCTNAE